MIPLAWDNNDAVCEGFFLINAYADIPTNAIPAI